MVAAHRAYRQTEVTTADPKRLVMLCYEGAIQNLRRARSKLLTREYEEKGKAIQNALEILGALREALDFERGGSIAENLDRLYGFMSRQILTADRKKSVADFDHVVRMLEILKSAWEEALLGSQGAKEAMDLIEKKAKDHPTRESFSRVATF